MSWNSKKKLNSEQSASVQTRFLREPEVLDRVPVAWLTILRWEKEGAFPPRRKIGKRAVAWVEAEIDEWCAEKIAKLGGEEQ